MTSVSVFSFNFLILFLNLCFLNLVAFKIKCWSQWQSEGRSETYRLLKHPDPSFTFVLSSRMHQFSYCTLSSYIGSSLFLCCFRWVETLPTYYTLLDVCMRVCVCICPHPVVKLWGELGLEAADSSFTVVSLYKHLCYQRCAVPQLLKVMKLTAGGKKIHQICHSKYIYIHVYTNSLELVLCCGSAQDTDYLNKVLFRESFGLVPTYSKVVYKVKSSVQYKFKLKC